MTRRLSLRLFFRSGPSNDLQPKSHTVQYVQYSIHIQYVGSSAAQHNLPLLPGHDGDVPRGTPGPARLLCSSSIIPIRSDTCRRRNAMVAVSFLICSRKIKKRRRRKYIVPRLLYTKYSLGGSAHTENVVWGQSNAGLLEYLLYCRSCSFGQSTLVADAVDICLPTILYFCAVVLYGVEGLSQKATSDLVFAVFPIKH